MYFFYKTLFQYYSIFTEKELLLLLHSNIKDRIKYF